MKVAKFFSALFSGGIKGHFGQWAEDVLVRKLFPREKKLGVYLDLGAYHPFTHSNTAYFWMKGWHGFNVDANPKTIELFQKIRKSDTNIWTAIVPESDYASGIRNVSLMLPSKADYASGIAASGTISQTVGGERGFSASRDVPATCVSELIQKYSIQSIDYLNIDIEGYDEIILKEIDFSIINPKVVTIEDYSDSLDSLSKSSISLLMQNREYELVGRAGLTSVFVKK